MNVKTGSLRHRPLQVLSWSALALAALALTAQIWDWLEAAPHVRAALGAGGVAAFATALGAVPVVATRALGERLNDSLLGFSAGVMLAAACFSLIAPALEAAAGLADGAWTPALIVGAGVLLGAVVLMLAERFTPHAHFIEAHGGDAARARRVRGLWLFVFAIVLHNIPEGLALGVAAAGPDADQATALTTGIALQNVPEGLVVAVALISAGLPRLPAFLISAASGLVEPAAAVLGAMTVGISAPLLPWGLAFAAGAMLFVVSHELIPESHRQGHERYSTVGLTSGFVLMMVLDAGITA
jgi:zinc transporter, ZIP family